MLNNYRTNNQSRVFTALILTGILSLSSGFSLIKNATAASTNLLPEVTNEVLKQNFKSNRLPRPVANAVLQDLSRRQGIPKRELQITDYSQQTWRNGCLELAQPGELCTQALVPGWRVVVSNGRQNWIYHTNSNGRFLRLNDTRNPTGRLPGSIRNAVLQDVSRRLQEQTSQLTIIESQQQTWRNGCLELADDNQVCTQALVPGWRVVVSNGRQNWIYHTNQTGSVVRLKEKDNQITDNKLPQRVRNAVLQLASRLTGLRTSKLRVVQSERIMTDGCLNLPRPNEACTKIALQAWKVTVVGDKQRLVFHAKQDASDIRLNQAASSGITGAVPIPASELPPPLDRDMVFRQISSGGFAGRTYQTVLLNDGTLIRVRIGDANDSERSVRRISPQQVRQFERFLERSKFGEYRNLSYPAPGGAADFITYTFTSREGTVQYNDISLNNLPRDLREVVNTWNQLVSDAQR
jgi:outer membrane lipoprotein-sorting protein